MQKAILVKTSLEPGNEGAFSFEVDPVASGPKNPLRRLLAAGWEVVQVCPMTTDLESAALVILDRPSPGPHRPASRRDTPMVEMNHPSPWHVSSSGKSGAASGNWDGETIPLGIFRVDGSHAETTDDS